VLEWKLIRGFMKIRQQVKKLKSHRHTHTQTHTEAACRIRKLNVVVSKNVK